MFSSRASRRAMRRYFPGPRPQKSDAALFSRAASVKERCCSFFSRFSTKDARFASNEVQGRVLLRRHSTLWIVAISLLGTAAVALRWLLQETGALWTKLRFRPYLPDPDLGWRRSDEAYVWLGLDALASTFFLALAIGGAAFYLRRRERLLGAPAPRLRAILVALSLPSLVLPLLAFASGLPADEGRETRPLRRASAPESGIAGALPDLPSGSYELLPHPEAALVARLEAGGEVFEARFAGGLEGRVARRSW